MAPKSKIIYWTESHLPPASLPDLVGYYTGRSSLAGPSGTLPYLALGLATALAMLGSEILTRQPTV